MIKSAYLFLGLVAVPLLARDASLAELKAKAAAGDVAAEVLLAADYDFGHGVNADPVEAVRWYEKAATAGDKIAENNLADLYQHGCGVGADLAKALEFYRKSAEQGFAPAQTSLGLMYDQGQGVPQDRKVANELYRKAAEQGFPAAMLDLAMNLHNGAGMAPDKIEAYKWLDVARFVTQQSSDKQLKWRVRGMLDALSRELTPVEVKEGQQRSRSWWDAHGRR